MYIYTTFIGRSVVIPFISIMTLRWKIRWTFEAIDIYLSCCNCSIQLYIRDLNLVSLHCLSLPLWKASWEEFLWKHHGSLEWINWAWVLIVGWTGMINSMLFGHYCGVMWPSNHNHTQCNATGYLMRKAYRALIM